MSYRNTLWRQPITYLGRWANHLDSIQIGEEIIKNSNYISTYWSRYDRGRILIRNRWDSYCQTTKSVEQEQYLQRETVSQSDIDIGFHSVNFISHLKRSRANKFNDRIALDSLPQKNIRKENTIRNEDGDINDKIIG